MAFWLLFYIFNFWPVQGSSLVGSPWSLFVSLSIGRVG